MTKKLDPRSADPVLFATGDGPDLSANNLARLAWIGSDPRPDSPLDIPDTDLDALADELVASGSYTRKPATPAKPEELP